MNARRNVTVVLVSRAVVISFPKVAQNRADEVGNAYEQCCSIAAVRRTELKLHKLARVFSNKRTGAPDARQKIRKGHRRQVAAFHSVMDAGSESAESGT
jgi:hypothetical protein